MGAAFGLQLAGQVEGPGLDQPATGTAGRRTELRLVDRAAIDLLAVEAEQELYSHVSDDGRAFRVLGHPQGGYVLVHDHFGGFAVDPRGTAIDCAPTGLETWRWQRFLTGQLLPLAALLHGLEPLHASSVAVDGRALACLGGSGAGKTSVAVHMADTGATLMGDDVAAAEDSGGILRLHPAAAVASVAETELAHTRADGPVSSWDRLGVEEGEVRVVARARAREALPLGWVYILRRGGHAGQATITPLVGSVPRVLLGSTFNAYHLEGERLVGQLALCAAISNSVPVLEVAVPSGVSAREVAAMVLADASGRR